MNPIKSERMGGPGELMRYRATSNNRPLGMLRAARVRCRSPKKRLLA